MAGSAQIYRTWRDRRRRHFGQRGFTLVELLVVITIIGVLMAMLIPVVGRVREYAHRTQCISNQSQIGLAMSLYATTKGKMPSVLSTYVDPLTATGSSYTIGWAVALMSDLGRSDLAPGTLPIATLQSALPNIAILICPSDPTKVGASGGPESYVVNAGCPNSYSATPVDWNANGAWNYSIGTTAKSNTGLNTSITLEFISRHDGTSTTVSHSENLDAPGYFGSSANPLTAQSENQQAILWSPTVETQFNQNVGTTPYGDAEARPSSNHPGGAVVSFCDGSVKFIQQTIAYNVYASLMTSYGAQAAPPGTAFSSGNAYQSLQIAALDASQIPTN